MNRIRKGDHVIVTAGKDKGKKGDVVRVAGDKVVVSSAIPSRTRKPDSPAA
jgi:large subunit ribosomal protein L24